MTFVITQVGLITADDTGGGAIVCADWITLAICTTGVGPVSITADNTGVTAACGDWIMLTTGIVMTGAVKIVA